MFEIWFTYADLAVENPDRSAITMEERSYGNNALLGYVRSRQWRHDIFANDPGRGSAASMIGFWCDNLDALAYVLFPLIVYILLTDPIHLDAAILSSVRPTALIFIVVSCLQPQLLEAVAVV